MEFIFNVIIPVNVTCTQRTDDHHPTEERTDPTLPKCDPPIILLLPL